MLSAPAATGVRLLSQTFAAARMFPRHTDVSCLTSGPENRAPSGSLGAMTGECPQRDLLVHLCPADQWYACQAGELRPESLADAGFVHLSSQQQVHLPANRLFAGRTDLVLLYVDPARLSAPLRWETGVAGDPEGMLFPHLFGALPAGAVVAVRAYPPGPDGRFAPLIPSPGQLS